MPKAAFLASGMGQGRLAYRRFFAMFLQGFGTYGSYNRQIANYIVVCSHVTHKAVFHSQRLFAVAITFFSASRRRSLVLPLQLSPEERSEAACFRRGTDCWVWGLETKRELEKELARRLLQSHPCAIVARSAQWKA